MKPTAHGLIALTLCVFALNTNAQRLVNWTEEAGELGLGYPVPIPQNTPLPFDGFRSYFALNARHLDLTNTRDDFTRFIIGNTENGRPLNMYVMSDLNPTTVDGPYRRQHTNQRGYSCPRMAKPGSVHWSNGVAG